jgi:hypothetical protein
MKPGKKCRNPDVIASDGTGAMNYPFLSLEEEI